MDKKKPKWAKPKLTVLVRSKQAEAVLAGCKLLNVATGPSNAYLWCDLSCSPACVATVPTS